MTATNGQTRRSHYDTSHPLKIRYDQKIQKYANAAHAVGCRLIPCVLSYAGQIHHEIEVFVRGVKHIDPFGFWLSYGCIFSLQLI